LTQPWVELSVTDVERDHASDAALQQHVREAAGRRSDVESVDALDGDRELVERMCELLAAARDEARRPLDDELSRLVDLLARLRMAGYEPSEDECLGLRAALGEPALDEQHIEPLLHVREASFRTCVPRGLKRSRPGRTCRPGSRRDAHGLVARPRPRASARRRLRA